MRGSLKKRLMEEVFKNTTTFTSNNEPTLPFQQFQQKMKEVGERLNIKGWMWLSTLTEEKFKKFLEKNKNWGGVLKYENGVVILLLQIPKPHVSFGIEFEGNMIGKRGIVRYTRNRYFNVGRWDYQNDPTASFELRSPVWEDILEASEDIKSEFREWILRNDNISPFFKPTKYYYSIGGHIHIGVGEGKRVSKEDAVRFINKLVRFLPFIYFINANGIVEGYISKRMITHPYSPLKTRKEISSGREEWWLSEHGTIEFRRFDANIPAVQLACVFLIKNIIENMNVREDDSWKPQLFQNEVRECCKYPTNFQVLLEVRERFREIGNVSIKNLPKGVKEVLILSFVFLKNPSLFQKTFNYEFCRKAVEEIGFLEDESKYSGDRKLIVRGIEEMVNRVEKLNDLLNIVVVDRESEYLIKLQNIKGVLLTPLRRKQSEVVDKWLKKINTKPPFIYKKMWRNIIKERMIERKVRFLRLRELTPTQISKLESLTQKNINSMIEEVGRYYIKVRGDDVLGYVKFNVPEKRIEEIKNVEKEEVRFIINNYLRGSGICVE
jgi:hypothetical protein